MRLHMVHILCFCAAATLIGGPALAQKAQPAARPQNAAKATDPKNITAQLRSNDNYLIQQAVTTAISLLGDIKTSKKAADEAVDWLKILLAQRRIDEIDELALAAICAQAESTNFVEKCQELRIRAKLVDGKPQEALVLAKGLYNVCAMPNTGHAIDVISECLYDANKDNNPVAAIKQFKMQQLRGASISAATQPSEIDAKNVISQIKVDPKDYESGLETADLKDDGFAALMAKGNLLLLSDRAKDARAIFEKAFALASDKNLAPAAESIARAMRAEDGCVGRANAWILSLRPQESAMVP